MPHIPEMRVTAPFARGVIGPVVAAPGRTRPIGRDGVHLSQCRGKFLVKKPVVFRQLFPVRQEFVMIAAKNLVVAAPKGERRPVAQSPPLKLRLGARAGDKFPIRRIKGAGKHEVLPNQQSKFVAQIVKILALIDATTPHADHVHVGLRRADEITFVISPSQPGHKAMCRNPVRSFRKNRPAVDHELKRLAPFILMAVEGDRAQANATFPPAKARPIRPDCFDLKSIKRLHPLAIGPPKSRIVD